MKILLFTLALLPACAATEDDVACTDGKCDAGSDACNDTRYGDGTCQIDLSCAAPDIDCFRTFDDDTAAIAWFSELEPQLAQLEGRQARNVVATTDPRYAKFHALLDRGWDSFRDTRPVGQLRDRRPALVIVEDPTVNAFVMPESLEKKRASFAVMVHTTTLETPTSDAANLGLVMHELQHAVGLHVVEGVKERITKFYFASPDNEPIGYKQTDNADAREALTAWRNLAAEVGPLSNAELRGMPTGGILDRVFRTIVATGAQTNPTGCAHARELLNGLLVDLQTATDLISGAPHLDATYASRVTAAFTALRDECLVNYTKTFYDVAAQLVGVTPAEIQAQTTADDKALIDGKHVVDALVALGENRRMTMRSIESLVQTQLATPWSLIRFYTEEEAADDVTVPVLRGAKLDAVGLATFFLEVLMPTAQSQACSNVLATSSVPAYGVDMFDTHHSVCWRVYHVQQLARDAAPRSARRSVELHTPAPIRTKLPIPAQPTIEVY